MLTTIRQKKKKTKMRLPGVEPGSIAWKAIILTVGLQTLACTECTMLGCIQFVSEVSALGARGKNQSAASGVGVGVANTLHPLVTILCVSNTKPIIRI